jgi:hypothetical protein
MTKGHSIVSQSILNQAYFKTEEIVEFNTQRTQEKAITDAPFVE